MKRFKIGKVWIDIKKMKKERKLKIMEKKSIKLFFQDNY